MLTGIFMGLFCILVLMISVTIFIFMINLIKKQKLELQNIEKDIVSNLISQEETIKGLLEIIDIQIGLEIAHSFLPYLATSKQFEALNVDKICNKICMNVFNKFNKEQLIKFTKVNNIYEYSFWMDYIIKKTSCLVVETYLKSRRTNE